MTVAPRWLRSSGTRRAVSPASAGSPGPSSGSGRTCRRAAGVHSRCRQAWGRAHYIRAYHIRALYIRALYVRANSARQSCAGQCSAGQCISGQCSAGQCSAGQCSAYVGASEMLHSFLFSRSAPTFSGREFLFSDSGRRSAWLGKKRVHETVPVLLYMHEPLFLLVHVHVTRFLPPSMPSKRRGLAPGGWYSGGSSP